MVEHSAGHEAEEVKEVIWQYTGWVVILLVCIGAGVFIGYSLWGDAAALRNDLDKQTEMVGTLKNERETLKSQLALTTRDKEECEKQLAAAGRAPAGGSPSSAGGGGEQPGGGLPATAPDTP
jgi:hypothetical protein